MSGELPPPNAARFAAQEARALAEQVKREAAHAATFGLCSQCSRVVGADGIHAWDCTRVPTERRENRGRTPQRKASSYRYTLAFAADEVIARIEALETDVSRLEGENAELRAVVAELREMNERGRADL